MNAQHRPAHWMGSPPALFQTNMRGRLGPVVLSSGEGVALLHPGAQPPCLRRLAASASVASRRPNCSNAGANAGERARCSDEHEKTGRLGAWLPCTPSCAATRALRIFVSAVLVCAGRASATSVGAGAGGTHKPLRRRTSRRVQKRSGAARERRRGPWPLSHARAGTPSVRIPPERPLPHTPASELAPCSCSHDPLPASLLLGALRSQCWGQRSVLPAKRRQVRAPCLRAFCSLPLHPHLRLQPAPWLLAVCSSKSIAPALLRWGLSAGAVPFRSRGGPVLEAMRPLGQPSQAQSSGPLWPGLAAGGASGHLPSYFAVVCVRPWAWTT